MFTPYDENGLNHVSELCLNVNILAFSTLCVTVIF